MRKTAILLLSGLLLGACATNPFSGKSTLALTPNSQLFPMSFQQYDDFLKEHKAITGTQDAKRIEDIGKKIKGAAEKWLNANGHKDYLKDYQWEYNLVDNDEYNAWCMPGGKIVFYTGILPICKTDAGIAVVMGHEVAHALANHGQQRMSNAMLQQLGAVGLDVLTQKSNPQAKQMWAAAYGYGTQYGVMLPFSRSNESEADKIGLTLMAIAGYNPEEAVAFWSRMAEKTGGGDGSSFTSTHPSNKERIDQLRKLIPEAKAEAAKYGISFN
ncbi:MULTISPECIES: M48 family metallopeptidase [Myroides]|uniref:M48 family metalloprotease n=1 Tax=Myroides albus TaxID=2562892 RepID=A0A6I3LHK3_9FLAO|nr:MULTISPECIES: M48 family metallopeptidase [Myroides]MTG97988.1 M48 family metalloprotease [Myroides albus]MVX34863.1 M48 family metalloprotease [Myroides sp. LoEW2-1]UVD80279.1 M48 family metallopeptidase [Myroides albus]